ncbi:hypothetical protein LTS18_006509 [Coniosporium uncinatum]|uniref:Uncharacterized protein n=1 Tax=Coniosporium uncinatum TaxID=93489 RepID=A0ACC3DY66_9PEZI|nr:hypothetical protein LTS18_006509 [Coniosporium uncinatum]
MSTRSFASDANLAALPPELLHEILSYLPGIYACVPHSTGLHYHESSLGSHVKDATPRHPYLRLAATCRSLREGVEAWCAHLLRTLYTALTQTHPASSFAHDGSLTTHHPLQKPRETNKGLSALLKPFPKTPWKETPPPLLRPGASGDSRGGEERRAWPLRGRGRGEMYLYRTTWLHFASRFCAFCGKASSRRAVFNSLLLCCKKCDKEAWPEKITKTEAKTKHHLNDSHLFDPARPLRHAVYDCCGVDTTMFLLRDVEARAKEVFGEVGYVKRIASRGKRKRGVDDEDGEDGKEGRQKKAARMDSSSGMGSGGGNGSESGTVFAPIILS